MRDSVLEAIGGNVTAAAAGMRTVLEARADMRAAIAALAARDVALHTALLDVQAKQSAAAEALKYSKNTAGKLAEVSFPNVRAAAASCRFHS